MSFAWATVLSIWGVMALALLLANQWDVGKIVRFDMVKFLIDMLK